MAHLPKMRRVGAGSKPPAHSGRTNNDREFYKSNRWAKASRAWRSDNPLCVECDEEGITTDCSPGLRRGVTDHIIPISRGGARLDPKNFQTLCNRHHDIKSAKEK